MSTRYSKRLEKDVEKGRRKEEENMMRSIGFMVMMTWRKEEWKIKKTLKNQRHIVRCRHTQLE